MFPPNGNAGIGTNNPGYKLEVVGSIKTDTMVFPDGTVQTSALSSSFQNLQVLERITLGNSMHSEAATISASGNYELWPDDAHFWINSLQATPYNFNTILNANANTGNVGIGAVNPTAKLHVSGTFRLQDDYKLSAQGSVVSSSVWDIEPHGETGKLHIGTLTDTVITIEDDDHNNVGIGTTDPQRKLHVKTQHFVLVEPPLPPCLANPELACDSLPAGNVGSHRGIRLEDYTLFNTGLELSTAWDIIPDFGGFLSFGMPGNTPALILVTDPLSGASGVTASGSFHTGSSIHLYGASGKIESTTLEVAETAHTGSSIHLYGANGKIESMTLDVAESIKVGTGSLMLGTPDGIAENNIWTTNNDLILQNDGQNNPNGRVGIHTSTPNATLHVNGNAIIGTESPLSGQHTDYRLAVDGKLLAKQMHTTMNDWGDYVFEDRHKRMHYDERALYYRIFKRMPLMASAEDVIKNGLDVGNTLYGLTVNLEEISLNQIDLYRVMAEKNNKIAELETENELRKQEVKALKKEMDAVKKEMQSLTRE